MANTTQRTVIHLEIIENGDVIHKYYGSTSSLFDKYSPEQLGVNANALNKFFFDHKDDETIIYENLKCRIRRGELYTKPTTRGRKPLSDNDVSENKIMGKFEIGIGEALAELKYGLPIHAKISTSKRGRGGKEQLYINFYHKADEKMLINQSFKIGGMTYQELMEYCSDFNNRSRFNNFEEYEEVLRMIQRIKK